MAQSAKKFVYTIAANYEGKGELKKLQDDLSAIGKIESFEKLRADWQKTNKEFTQAKAKMRELRAAMKDGGGKEVEKQYAAAAKQVKKLGTALGNQKSKLTAVNTALKGAGIAASGLATSYKQLKTAADGQGKILAAQMALGVRSTKSVRIEIDGLRNAYKTLKTSGTQSVSDLARAKEGLRSKVAALKSETGGWATSLNKIKIGWGGVLATAGSVAAAARGITFFAGFDDSMREVAAVSNATGEEMQKMTEFAKEMGATTRFTATEAAQGMAELAQSGMKTNEIFQVMPDVMNLSSASGMQFKQTADLVTDTMKQFNLGNSESGRVADVIAKGYSSAGTSAEQLGAALSYVGPIARSVGYSLEDTVGIIDALAEVGYKGQRGGTALRGGLTRLLDPTKKVRAVLNDLNIKIEDSSGKMRPFADIIDDLGKAGLTSKQALILFGQEAGPGMVGLVAQGGDAIRGLQKQMAEAAGTAAQIAGDKEAGIGGALRKLQSALNTIVIEFGSTLAPAIQAAAEMFTVFARVVAAMPAPIKVLVAAVTTGGVAFVAWHSGLKQIFGALRGGVGQLKDFGGTLGGVNDKAVLTGKGMGILKKSFVALTAFSFGWEIGTWLNQFDIVQKAGIMMADVLHSSFLKIKLGWAWVSGGDTAAVQAEAESVSQIYREMYNEVGQVAVDSSNKIAQAATSSATATTAAITAAAVQQKQATIEVTDAMESEWKAYADTINGIQDSITGRQRSLKAELSAMNRTGMSDTSAWRDQKREAQEYEQAAKIAAKAGNFDAAIANADKAKAAYKALNHEVKDGDKVVVSGGDALKTSMAGVKSAGLLAIDILKQQEEQAKKAADALNFESGWQMGEAFTEAGDEAKKLAEQSGEVGKKWRTMFIGMEKDASQQIKKIAKDLDELAKDRTANLYIKEIQASAIGGMIGYVQKMATGGGVGFKNALNGLYLRGYGGGDRRHVLAEDGEVMIRKEMVASAGPKAALAFNAGQWGVVVSELVKRFNLNMGDVLKRQTGGFINSTPNLSGYVQKMAAGGMVAGGGVSETININLSLPGAVAPVSLRATKSNAEQLLRDITRMQRLASS